MKSKKTLKTTNMAIQKDKKSKFLLENEFKAPLNFEDFQKAKQAYLKAVMGSKFRFESTTDIFKLIENVKRKPETIGPYEDLTAFEALNRIGSDLVLLVGAELLFRGEKGFKADTVKLEMGNQNGFDLIIQADGIEILGEAFNVAESFCKIKYDYTIEKFKKKAATNEGIKLKAVILVNAERKENLENYHTKKMQFYKTSLDVQVIYCDVNTLKTLDTEG
jgi:hypothetical protein